MPSSVVELSISRILFADAFSETTGCVCVFLVIGEVVVQIFVRGGGGRTWAGPLGRPGYRPQGGRGGRSWLR